MLNIKIVCVGKMKEKFYMDAYNEYAKRLGAYCRLELVELPESTLDKEAAAVLKYFDKSAYIISMAIEGKKVSSQGLSDMIEQLALNGRSELIFVIGGSEGLADEVKQKSDCLLSMSDMTFPHHLARVMLAEQVYRSFKIAEGSQYHK